MLIDIWLPDKLYHTMPFLCLAAASVVWFIPATVTAAACSGALYLYGLWSLWRRFSWSAA